MGGVTIAIPTIPARADYLRRAVASVSAQTLPAESIAIAIDVKREGAWVNRNRALRMALEAGTEWVAFLDDDDELMPHYIEHLYRFALSEQADVVWGWYDVIGGGDPFPHYRGRQYDPAQPHIVPITYMAKAAHLRMALRQMGGFQPDTIGSWDLQDMPLLNTMYNNGARFRASEETVWKWHHHGRNTSGMPERW